MNDKTSNPASSSKRSARLKQIGVIVLVLGIAGAGVLYWMRTRSPNLSDDSSMAGYSKKQKQQMGVMYGKMGTMTDDLLADLKRPGTQAFLIVAVAGLASWLCFFAARPVNDDHEAR